MPLMPEDNPNYHAAVEAINAGHRVIMVDDNGEPLSPYNKSETTDSPQLAYVWWLCFPDAKCGVVPKESAND